MQMGQDSIGLLRPDLLVWSAALLLLAWFLVRLRLKKISRLKSLGVIGTFRISYASSMLPLVPGVLMFAALLRPYNGYQEFKVASQGGNIMVVADVSLSMLAQDASPTRLDAMSRKLEDLIGLIQERKAGERLGLVVFAGGSYVLCPLTSDYAVLRMYVKALSADLISSEGSGINGALETALQSLRDARVEEAQILLLSDGEDNYFEREKARVALEVPGFTLHSLGFGSKDGQPIESSSGHFLTDLDGNTVISRLNEANLSTLAALGKGRYRQATLDDSDLRSMLPSPRSSISGNAEGTLQTIRVYNEVGPLVLILVLAVVVLAYFRRMPAVLLPLILLSLFSTALQAQTPPSLYESYKAYQAGDFERALSGFEAQNRINPRDLDTQQALASTLYKLGRHAEAARLFGKTAEEAQASSSGAARRYFENLYNRGNAEFLRGDLKEAIQKYEEALKIKENDPQTLHNLELARKRLEEKENQKAEQQENKQSENQSAEQKQSDKNTEQPKDESPQEQSVQPGEEQTPAEKDNPQADPQGEEPVDGQEQAQEAASENKPDSSGEIKPENGTALPGSPEREPGEESQKAFEARQWLESLDDSPLLLNMKKESKERVNPQSW